MSPANIASSGEDVSVDGLLVLSQDRLMARLLYQNPTRFGIARLVGGSVTHERPWREDTEVTLDYRRPIFSDLTLHIWGENKNLEVPRQEVSTPRRQIWNYTGWMPGTTWFYESSWWGRPLDLSVSAWIALLEAELSENRLMGNFSFTKPYSYDIRGYFFDIGFHASLCPRLHWMIGFKLQEYRAVPHMVDTPDF